jgi:iron(III) transport system substrate-binding protein
MEILYIGSSSGHIRMTIGVRSTFAAIMLCLFLILGVIACQSSDHIIARSDAPNDRTSMDQGSLVLYSGRSESLIGPLIKGFELQTGIDVRVKYGKTTSLAATLIAEGRKSPADVYFAQDPGGLGTVSELFAELPVSVTKGLPRWSFDGNRKWVGVSARARTLVYNPERVDESELPHTLWDLTDPKWNGRIGWAPANSSLVTMISGMRDLWGDPATIRWLRGFLANHPVIYPTNTPQVSAVESGEIDIGLVNHYYLYRYTAENTNFQASNLYLSNGGPGSMVMVSGIGILSTAKNKTNALIFLSYLLDDQAQAYFADTTFEYPLKSGIDLHSGLPSLDSLEIPAINLSAIADLEGTLAIMRESGAIP